MPKYREKEENQRILPEVAEETRQWQYILLMSPHREHYWLGFFTLKTIKCKTLKG